MRKWIVAACILTGGAVLATLVVPTTCFWRTAQISWTDTDPATETDGSPHVGLQAIEFGVVKQSDDPRFMGDNVVMKSVLVKAGEKAALAPALSSLPQGLYNVHARACTSTGTPLGRWSDPHQVRVDMQQPKSPSTPHERR